MHTSTFREDFINLRSSFEEFKDQVKEHNHQNDCLWKKEYLRDADLEKKISLLSKQAEDNSADYLYKFSKINTSMTELDDKVEEVQRKLE